MALAVFVAANAECNGETQNCDCDASGDHCESCKDGFKHWTVENNVITKCYETCPTGNEFSDGGICVSSCPDGKYGNEDKDCVACVDPCVTCSSESVCLSCAKGKFLSESTCKDCDGKCAVCSGQSTKCTECANKYKSVYSDTPGTILTDCVTPNCPNGTFEKETGKCFPCGDNCDVCTSATECTTCRGGYYASSGKCEVCNEKCATCSGQSTKCTECANTHKSVYSDAAGTVLTDCVTPDCPHWTFEKETGKCVPCGDNCDVCASATECETCKSGYYSNGGKCKECNPKCATCDTKDTCKTCKSDRMTVYEDAAGTKVKDCIDSQICPENNYKQGTDKCYPCHSSCKSCTNSSSCASCEDGYFVNPQNGQCEKCDNSCVQCSGSATSCTACKSKSFVSNNQCLQCNSKCGECDGSADNCTTCDSSKKSVYDKEGTTKKLLDCVDNCSNKQYKIDEACYPCDETCKTCTNSTSCATCETNQFIKDGKCVTCADKCDTCDGDADKCTKCNSEYKTVYADTAETVQDCISKDEPCPERTFDDGESHCRVCKPESHCNRCDDDKWCTQCLPDHPVPLYESEDAENFTCGVSCSGYEKDGRCISNCDLARLCKTCSDSHSCSSCNDGDMMFYDTEELAKNDTYFDHCVSGGDCPERSYVFEVNNIAVCVKTPENCFANDCATCKKGFKGDKCGEECDTFEFCPEGSSASTRGNCTDNCYGCNNDDATNGRSQCISCLENFALVNGECVPCGKNEKSKLGNTSDKCEKDGLATWAIAVIVVAAVVAVALVVGVGVGVSRCVNKAPVSDVLVDDNGIPLKPLSKKSRKSGEVPADAFI